MGESRPAADARWRWDRLGDGILRGRVL